eukprot:5098002-Pyramimonas_sp.AAC.1
MIKAIYVYTPQNCVDVDGFYHATLPQRCAVLRMDILVILLEPFYAASMRNYSHLTKRYRGRSLRRIEACARSDGFARFFSYLNQSGIYPKGYHWPT